MSTMVPPRCARIQIDVAQGNGALGRRSQVLAEAHCLFDFRVAEMFVRTTAVFVVEQRIRSHLDAIARSRPLLTGGDQSPPNAAAPRGGFDVPTFDVTHRTRVATVREWSQAHFDETGQALIGFAYKDAI
jgi:hypothetical protein